MKRSAFQQWMTRIGLAAALLLIVVPTAGRVVHAAASTHAAHAGTHHGHTAHRHGIDARDGHAADARHGDRQGRDARPAIGDPDCDYCPLLSSMAEVAAIRIALAQVPRADRPFAAPTAPLLRWRHPWGLGSRGPP